MPFVFVYMVEKDDPDSGRLILDFNKEFKEVNLDVGEGIFMQGSQIKHIAKRCKIGNRTTLVLSFLPKDNLIRDGTYVTSDMEPYHKNERLHEQYLVYKYERLRSLEKMRKKVLDAIKNEKNDIHRSRL
jgi:hypothetical protein